MHELINDPIVRMAATTLLCVVVFAAIVIGLKQYKRTVAFEWSEIEIRGVFSYLTKRWYKADWMEKYLFAEVKFIVESAECPESPSVAKVYSIHGEYLGEASEVK